ncbi:hypothetical protein [Rahnella bonaserana]|jgi:hypothetical protein
MMTEDELDKAIQKANERERYLWRYARWFIKTLWFGLFMAFLVQLIQRYFQC